MVLMSAVAELHTVGAWRSKWTDSDAAGNKATEQVDALNLLNLVIKLFF